MAFQSLVQIFRDYVVDGVPSSGLNKPKKSEIRGWAVWAETLLNALGINSGFVYQTRALLYADLTRPANTMAWVTNDANVSFNGIYQKVGASGAGSWTRVADLPYSYISAADSGTGTANAIQATTSIPISSSALIVLNVFRANTGSPVTVSFNGGTPLTVKTNAGNNLIAGALVAGMQLLGVAVGSTFRLLSDQASSAIIAQAEDAANRAIAAAAGLALPSITVADAKKVLVVKDDGTGYSLSTKVLMFEQLLNYHASLALEMAERGAVVMAGPDGSGFFDGFNALTYVDVAGAINLDTSTAGELKGTVSTATVTSGGSPAGTNDFSNLTMVDRTFTLTNGRTVTKIGAYSTVARAMTLKIVERTGSGVYAVRHSQSFAHPGGGWADMTLSTPYATPASGTFYVASYYAIGSIEFNGSRNRAYITGDVTGSGLSFTEQASSAVTAHRAVEITGASNLTVTSQPFALSSMPEWAFVCAFVSLVDAVSNTDISFSVSRDGTNYAAASMTKRFDRLGGSVALASAVIDLRSLASGTTGKWKITTQNLKRPVIQAVGISYGVYQ